MAVVTSLRPLDREAAPTRLLPLVVGDARGLTATTTVTVTITDVNDNPMRPGAKVVSVTRITVSIVWSLSFGLGLCGLVVTCFTFSHALPFKFYFFFSLISLYCFLLRFFTLSFSVLLQFSLSRNLFSLVSFFFSFLSLSLFCFRSTFPHLVISCCRAQGKTSLVTLLTQENFTLCLLFSITSSSYSTSRAVLYYHSRVHSHLQSSHYLYSHLPLICPSVTQRRPTLTNTLVFPLPCFYSFPYSGCLVLP